MRNLGFAVVVLLMFVMVIACGKGRPTQDQAGLDSNLGSSSYNPPNKQADSPQVDLESAAPTSNDEGYVEELIAPPSGRDIAALERLNPPVYVTASDGTYNDKVKVSWHHPSGVAPAVYYIYRSLTPNNPNPTYIGGRSYPGRTYDDTTATPGTTYYYKVKSHRYGYNDSFFSNEDSGCRSNRMNPPTNVQASDGTYTDKVRITWNHPTGTAPVTYYIYRSTTANNPSPTFIGGRLYPNMHYDDTSVYPQTTYYYKVKSHKYGYLDSYFSNEDSGYRAHP